NLGTTYFILYIREPDVPPIQQTIARITAAGLTYVLNSAFMAIVFWLFHLTRRNVGGVAGYAALVLYWMSFEYIHMQWSINWPWLNLGNVFAQDVHYVQWYEQTGIPGGTLWILLVNLTLFTAIKARWQGRKARSMRMAIGAVLLIVLPLVISLIRYSNYEEQGEAVEVVCVQPNLDPYEVKFKTDPIQQLERMLELCDSADTENTRFYVLPETALQEGATVFRAGGQVNFRGLWEHQVDATLSTRIMRNFLADKEAAMVVGAADRKAYPIKETPTARYIVPLDLYYDSYNSTWLVTRDGVEAIYRKSKLVPGVESIPFVSVLSFLDDLALDLGGASGSLGIQAEREVFRFDSLSLSPTICYESVFGDFNTEFVRNGSEAIFISTNDSWWQDSPGYKQLLAYGRLRAIETRRGIARSANTGITCFIDQKGDITSALEWVTEGALRGELYFNEELTFYAQHGDYLSRVAALISVLLLLWTWVRPLKGKP
ncbi:MAG: apolipoprotein N-acyltransferase, partial [Flavobacteriales bacterium]|nr:apolipoprotein N-acyltransferase [Flavobacteriales bacterium]